MRTSVALVALLLLMTAMPAAAREPVAAPEAAAGYVRLVRALDAGDLELDAPTGIAIDPGTGELIVSDAAGSAAVVAPWGARTASLDLGSARTGERSIAFDPRSRRVGVLDRAGRQVAIGASRTDLRAVVSSASALAYDADGNLLVLDASGRSVTHVPRGATSRDIVASSTRVQLGVTGDLTGLAVDSTTGHLFTIDRATRTLYELDGAGRLVASRDLVALGIASPVAIAVGPSADGTDPVAVQSTYVADAGANGTGGQVAELSFAPVALAPSLAGAVSGVATLVNTIDTSAFPRFSPDPSGLAYSAGADRLLLVDGEIEEPTFTYHGTNGWLVGRTGSPVVNAFNTTDDKCTPIGTFLNKEPVGVAINPVTGNVFISNDGKQVVWELNPSTYAVIRCFDIASRTGASVDPEGLAFTPEGNLLVADGVGAEIWEVSPGGDAFGNANDVLVSRFDTASLGQPDPEGVEFDPATGHLWIVSNKDGAKILEATRTGVAVAEYTVSGVVLDSARGLTLAPGTTSSETHVYIADAREDNNSTTPPPNDGRIYEFSVNGAPPPAACADGVDNDGDLLVDFPADPGCASATDPDEFDAPTGQNLLTNGSFETDAAPANSIPDGWGTNAAFTRSTDVSPSDGTFTGRHRLTTNSGYSIYQQVAVTAGTTYTISGLINGPDTSDTYSLKIKLQWRPASGSAIRTDVVTTQKNDTNGQWLPFSASIVAPPGATAVRVIMTTANLNASVYVDGFVLAAQ